MKKAALRFVPRVSNLPGRPVLCVPSARLYLSFLVDCPLKTRPKPVVFGLYGWSPEYGFRYVHPANRRAFELLEPVGKLFEKISEDEEGEWLTLRYDEQQFLVRPELFKEIYHAPTFSFGDSVEEVTPAPGQYRHFGLISDVFWDEATDTATYQIVQYKRKLPRVFKSSELRAD